MRMARLITGLILALVCVYLPAQPSEQEIAATGKLVRLMAIGGGSIGWILELESAVPVDGKPVSSILVSYRDNKELEKLENARVSVTGKIDHRYGVEKGEHVVLDLSSIKEAKATIQPPPVPPVFIRNIVVTGKLVRAMAIGGESTGWVLELESAITIDGQQVNSIQVSYRKAEQLEKLESTRVKVIGEITRRQGVETGEHLVLDASSIKEAKATSQSAPAQPSHNMEIIREYADHGCSGLNIAGCKSLNKLASDVEAKWKDFTPLLVYGSVIRNNASSVPGYYCVVKVF